MKKQAVTLLLLSVLGAGGCAEDIDGAAEQAQPSAEQALITSTSKVYHTRSVHTASVPPYDDYWKTDAYDAAFAKAKEFGLPVWIRESLNAGIGATSAQLIYCHDVNGVQGCESEWVDVFRNQSVTVPYHWNRSRRFGLQLVNNEWVASDVSGGRNGVGGVMAWYAGHVE